MLVMSISFVFVSCSKDDKEKEKNPSRTLASINIQGAKALFISSSNTGSKLYGVKSSALRSSNDDEIFEIKYINDDGEEIQKTNPAYIYNLKNFIVLAFGNEYYDFDETYLVKKSDGKVFSLPRENMPHVVGNKYSYDIMYFNTMNKIQEDGNNNMYYTTYQRSSPHKKTLYKVSLNSPSSLEFKEVSAVNDDVDGFCVDKSGNILYTYYDTNTQSKKYRYRKSAGNFINVDRYSSDEEQYTETQIVWTGTDGQMYSVTQVSQSVFPWENKFYLGKIQDGIFTLLREMNTQIEPVSTTVDGYPYSYVDNVFNIKGKIFYSQTNTLFNLSNEAEYAEIPCSVVANWILNDNLYSLNRTTFTLISIDATNGSMSVVYTLDKTLLGNYDIDKIVDVALDGVTFSAVDLNNGQYVVAKIFTDNTVVVQTSISGLVSTVMSLN